MKNSKHPHNLTQKLFKRFLYEWLVISAALAVIIITYATSNWPRYGYFIYDGFVNIVAKDQVVDNDIVLITVDEKSIRALGRWPWSRNHHADLIYTLQDAQPRVLGFSIFFTEAEKNKQADQRLKEAIEKSTFPVVMPVLQNMHDFYFSTSNTLLATVDIKPDPDGVIRRLKLMHSHETVFFPQLSLQAYWAAYQTGFSEDTLYDDMLINYSAKNRTGFKEVSYIDVVQGHYKQEDFNGKIILVGVTAAALGDRVATPLTTAHHAIDIHAQVLHNILHDNFIVEVGSTKSFYIELSIVFVFLLFAFLAYKIHLLYIAIAFSVVLLLASIVLLNAGIWWSPLSSIVVFFTAWAVWNWRRSLAVIAWCRHSVNYFKPSRHATGVNSALYGQRSMIQDRFQFELNVLEDMLVSAQKIEHQKSMLKTYLSHDLRSPHASMMALIRAQDHPTTALPEAEFYRMLEQLVQQSLNLLDDLLVLSRSEAESVQFEPVLLAAIVQDALDYLWPQFVAQHIEVVFNRDADELGEIQGDTKMLLRAITNVLENSIKYAGAGATVTIHVYRSGAQIVLSIADNGPGLNNMNNVAAQRPAGLAYTSYGLGLELVHSVVKSHHATLHSQDLDGQGAVFIFKFAALDAQTY